jgi:hypothetical protein
MKILIANDGMHAHFHERLAWTNALNSVEGVTCAMYNVKNSVAFDIFDTFEPDIYIGQLYNLSSATIKCIKERPHLKLALRAGEWNNEPVNPHILRVSDAELGILDDLMEHSDKPDLIYTHYLQKDIEQTHCNFSKFGIKLLGIPMSADIHTYGESNYRPELECDIAFVGGYWPYKGQVIDRYLTPLCYKSDFKIKIFGNQPWPHVNQYCGLINDSDVRDLFKSTKICPNLSEPHSQDLGIDVNERAFKILAAGGFCIMDNVRAAKEIFTHGIHFAESPEDFHDSVIEFLKPSMDTQRQKIAEAGRLHVLNHHTNYHRMIDMLNGLHEELTAIQIMETMNDHINRIQ